MGAELLFAGALSIYDRIPTRDFRIRSVQLLCTSGKEESRGIQRSKSSEEMREENRGKADSQVTE